MSRRTSRFVSDATGATALEFAMVAPVVVVLMIGVLNVGYALYCGAAVRHAVQQSSRALMFTPDLSAAAFKAKVIARLGKLPVGNLQVSIATETVTQTEKIKRVSWTYDYEVYVPFMPSEGYAMASNIAVPLPPAI